MHKKGEERLRHRHPSPPAARIRALLRHFHKRQPFLAPHCRVVFDCDKLAAFLRKDDHLWRGVGLRRRAGEGDGKLAGVTFFLRAHLLVKLMLVCSALPLA